MKKINIILITDDQHRWDFYDNHKIPSLNVPAIAWLRAEGSTMINAFSNCPICMPTRFTWLYGLYAGQVSEKLLSNAYDWPIQLHSMAHALKQTGYHTALIGKLHSHAGLYYHDLTALESETMSRGFDDVFEVSGKSLSYWYNCQYTEYLKSKGILDIYRNDVKRRCSQLGGHEIYKPSPLSPDDHMDGVIGKTALNWLAEYNDSKPFFLHASFCGPHFPLDPPEPYFKHYKPDDMPPPEGVNNIKEIREWQKQRALYCGLIEFIDEQIGKIMDMLQKKGLDKNTLILFTTDHGDMLGDFNISGKKQPYDSSCRTPVIARLPGVIPAGNIKDAMIEAVDLPCTILEAAGYGDNQTIIKLLPDTPGRSYWKYLTGKTEHHRLWSYSEHAQPYWNMCREKDWKYVLRPDQYDLLFNIKNDPFEQNNLINDSSQSDRINIMHSQLMKSMTHCTVRNRNKKK